MNVDPIRANLHYGPWNQTMENGLFQQFEFMVQLPWSDFLKISFEILRPITRCKPNVDQEELPCTKKWMCIFFIIHAQKCSFEKKNSCLTILLSSLGLHLSSLLVKCVEDVACKSFTTFSTKKNEWLNLYMFNVIYMWHVPCVVTTLNRIFSVCLNSILLLPYLAQH